MANSYFQFKQFTIFQDKCAMKVCTDSCLFGAWVTKRLATGINDDSTILDIGTGTGLLSLMIAQKFKNKIDAVEIDADASGQAQDNFSASPFNERLNVFNSSLQDFAVKKPKYDIIICNPPFYKNHLKGDHYKKNVAFHSSEMTFETLIKCSGFILPSKGYLAVIIPADRTLEFEKLCNEHKFFIWNKAFVRQTEKHTVFRTLLIVRKTPPEIITEEEFTIKINGSYSPPFIELLKDYYLTF